MSLEVRGVTVEYDGVPAVVDATVLVPDGSVLAVLGPSGCGKSTLLRAVAGLELPTAGTIAWDGRDLAGTPTHKRGFALMFQDGQLFGHLTVARNIGYALRIRRNRPDRKDLDGRVDELLRLVGLEGYADRLPATLSGGERQRVALARSLAAEPRLLLLDEPLSALHAILRAAGTTALLVTHDHEEAFAVADRIAVMRAGRIVQQGDIAEVWRAPADPETALFLGYARVLVGEAAARVVPGARAVAVRRSALRLDSTGGLTGRVVSARATPQLVRLVVDVDGVGELDAVAPLDRHPGPGESVRLAVDHTRTAVISGDGRAAGP
jgi:thiamine transport system ATP-binding protein